MRRTTRFPDPGSALALALLAASACTGSADYVGQGAPAVAPGEAKELTSFAFLAADNGVLTADVSGVVSGAAVTVTVPTGTAVTRLVPALTHTGATVSPASGAPQDFSAPVAYTVMAADGSTRAYLVSVTVAPSSAKDLTRFQVLGVDGAITGASIALTLPAGTAVTSLVPTIEHTGASVSPPSGVAHDFSAPSTYTVTAADGSTRAYTVSVAVAASSAKDLTRFSLGGVDGVISGTRITVTLGDATAVGSLSPTVEHSGASVSPPSGAANDFAVPTSYTVTAADGSTQTYSVRVAIAAPPGGDAIDLTQVEVHNSPADVAGWPVTTQISRLEMQSPDVGLSFTFPAQATWPDYTPPGWDGPLQYTVWAVVNVGGRWYSSGYIQMWNGRPSTGAPLLTDFARNWAYDGRWGPMQGHQPQVGELMGFFVTAGNARGVLDVTSLRERSNVVVVPVPAGDVGAFTF